MDDFKGRTVILAAGDFPRSPVARGALDAARRVVCCDSAASGYLRRMRRPPDAAVGDMDSLPASFRRRYPDRVFAVAEQDDNDLAKAFRLCLSNGWADILVLGATGGREDHTLANIAWLADFSESVPGVAMLTDRGVFTVARAPGARLDTAPGMQISFFGFDQSQRLSATGVKYPVERLALRRWFTATLNEATGACASLSFSGSPIVVFREIRQNQQPCQKR